MDDILTRHAPPGAVLPEPLLALVRDAYTQNALPYHNLTHVAEVLALVAEVGEAVGWNQPNEVYLAALFHDAVYRPGAKTNEAESADLAERAISRHLPGMTVDVGRVRDLILLTAKHGKLRSQDVDPEAALFLDCDMAILGAEPARFAAYDAAIAQEYGGIILRAVYAIGRGRFLRRLLEAQRIFLSDYFHHRLDTAARRNLREALGKS